MEMPNNASAEDSLQLLVAEDDSSQRQTISAIMAREGFEVIACAMAGEALERLRSGSIDVAVVDLRLPDLPEDELLRRLAAFAENVPIVLHTGYASLESARDAVNIGAFAYVEKGPDPAALVHQVHRAVRVHLVQRAEALEQAVAERIRDLKEANDALRQSEELFRTLTDSAPIGIYLTDANGDCTYVNARWSEMAGRTFDEAKGDKWVAALHPEDREAISSRWYRMTQSQDCWEGEYRFQDKQGKVSWVYGRAAPLTDDRGEVTGHVGANVDLTERKRAEEDRIQAQEELRASEEKYRHIVETANEGIWGIDAQANTQFANPRMAEMLGYSVEEMSGKPLMLFMDDEMQAEARRKLQRREQGIAEQYEHRFRRKDGTDLWAIVSTNPVFDDQGRYAGALAMITDLTERKLLEERLRHASKMEAVGQLASGVAHEFNNLLFGILGSAELMSSALEVELPEHFKRSLQDITKCGQRGAALTRQLLSFARKEVPEVTQFDINQVVNGIETVLRKLTGEFVTLEMASASNLPPIQADKGAIEQALMNLARNACDAMPDGGRLTIRTATEELDEGRVSANSHARPGLYVQLSVADTGCGMAPETVQRVFEPFFTTKPVGEGTGLGLSTVFADVTRSGGFIEVDSRPGEGTEFRVYLPAVEAKGVEAADDAKRSVKHCPGGTETSLVCDDDEGVLDSAAFLLESRGYSVVRAGGGREALEVAAAHTGTIELLLTDVTMPEMNGWELAKELTRQRPDTKVIFMSGYAADVFEAGAAEGEHIEFIEKPPMDDMLFRRIRELLDTPKRPAT